jgi:alkylation response protein AidB-like acyl-CoA dehydrogenase
MHFVFTEADIQFRQQARDWLQAHAPRTAAPHSGQASRDFVLGWQRQLHAAGWSGIAWPAAFGGRGLSGR